MTLINGSAICSMTRSIKSRDDYSCSKHKFKLLILCFEINNHQREPFNFILNQRQYNISAKIVFCSAMEVYKMFN